MANPLIVDRSHNLMAVGIGPSDMVYETCIKFSSTAEESTQGQSLGSVSPWEAIVKKEYLTDIDDEVPIWGPLQRDANQHELSDKSITEIEDLVAFLSLFFTPDVVGRVDASLNAGTHSWVGGLSSAQGTYASFVEKVIDDVVLTEDCDSIGSRSVASGPGSVPSGSGSGPPDTGCGSGSGEGGEDSEGWQRVTKKPYRPSRVGLQVKGGDQDEEDPEGYGEGYKGSERFANLEPIFVDLGKYDTPTKLTGGAAGLSPANSQRTASIRNRSLAFVRDANVSVCKPQFHPKREDDKGKYVYLFHGTRDCHLLSFQRNGIDPRSRAGDFSRLPTFYVTNSMRYAFEHPLLNHPHVKAHKPPRACTVSVLCFKVPVDVLCGELPPRANETPFGVRYYSEADDTWKAFCRYNWAVKSNDKRISYKQFDMTMGPTSMPGGYNDEGIMEFREVNRGNCRPLQVAFTSYRSQMWLAHHVERIFTERR